MPAMSSAQRGVAVGADLAASRAVQVLSSGSNNVKGAYVTMLDPTPFASDGLLFQVGDGGTGDFLVDIAIGAAASEQIVFENIQLSRGAGGMQIGHTVYLPFKIPAGVRVAMRCQTSNATSAIDVILELMAGGAFAPLVYERAVTYGAVTADSGGVSVDPGGTIHTKGAWTEIAAATTARIRHLMLCIGNQQNTSRSQGAWLLDIGVGSAGNEAPIVSNLLINSGSSTLDLVSPRVIAFPCDIPAGSRLVARSQSSINDATDRLFDVVAVGIG